MMKRGELCSPRFACNQAVISEVWGASYTEGGGLTDV